MWQIISYVLFGITSLAMLHLMILCIVNWKFILMKENEPTSKDEVSEIRQPQPIAYIALGGSVVFYLILIASTFSILGFRFDEEDLSYNVVFFAFFLLGFVLSLVSLNWKIELSEETFVHTNWRGKKRTYRYDEIEERELKSVSRFYKDGKFKFEISCFQDCVSLSERIDKAHRKQKKERPE